MSGKQKLWTYLGYEHAAQSHSGTEADTEAHGDNFVVGAEVDGYKGQPDNTGGVHGEGNVLSLVEISWDVAGLRRGKELQTMSKHSYISLLFCGSCLTLGK